MHTSRSSRLRAESLLTEEPQLAIRERFLKLRRELRCAGRSGVEHTLAPYASDSAEAMTTTAEAESPTHSQFSKRDDYT